jgi:hypothetical protein
MSDLQISGAVLNELHTTLTNIRNDLDGACRQLRSADATGFGAKPLVDRVHDFAKEWHYGIGEIGKHADECVSMLDQIGKAFDDIDAKLKAALEPKQDGGKV